MTNYLNQIESDLYKLNSITNGSSEVVEMVAELKDKYEKAKAYNDTLKTLDKLINDDERYKEARSNDFVAGMLIAYENIFNLMEDYIKGSGQQLDEYEKSKHRTHANDCKAEAFGAILKSYDEAFSREHMAGEVSNIIEKYESGGYDA